MTTSRNKHYCYQYRGEEKSGFYWSIMFLTDSGVMSIVGDTGEYGYSSFYTDDIRSFVLSLDPEDDYYLPTKLAKGRKTEFNGRQTLKEAKFHILEYRKIGEFSKEEAREAWDGLPEYYEPKEEWIDYLSGYQNIYGHEWYEFLQYDWDPMLISFCRNSLPGLQELIRKELEEEARLKELSVL